MSSESEGEKCARRGVACRDSYHPLAVALRLINLELGALKVHLIVRPNIFICEKIIVWSHVIYAVISSRDFAVVNCNERLCFNCLVCFLVGKGQRNKGTDDFVYFFVCANEQDVVVYEKSFGDMFFFKLCIGLIPEYFHVSSV